jgi:hypothetical protein
MPSLIESDEKIDLLITPTSAEDSLRKLTICFNCKTDQTSMWRRDENGNTVCNACKLYHKLHGKKRPPSMKRDYVRRRRSKNSLFFPIQNPPIKPKDKLCDLRRRSSIPINALISPASTTSIDSPLSKYFCQDVASCEEHEILN